MGDLRIGGAILQLHPWIPQKTSGTGTDPANNGQVNVEIPLEVQEPTPGLGIGASYSLWNNETLSIRVAGQGGVGLGDHNFQLFGGIGGGVEWFLGKGKNDKNVEIGLGYRFSSTSVKEPDINQVAHGPTLQMELKLFVNNRWALVGGGGFFAPLGEGLINRREDFYFIGVQRLLGGE